MAAQPESLDGLVIRAMTVEDMAAVQEVGVAAWSDIASRDLGRKVKYPARPRKIVEAYLWKEPEGCLVAERKGRIIGAAYTHVWGEVGWFGPFEVLPEMQDKGVGTALLRECERFLERRGCQVKGLETMSNHAKNIHFYMREGYRTIGSSLIMEKELRSEVEKVLGPGPSTCEEVVSSLGQISVLSRKGHPLVDYAREVEMAARHDLGAVLLLRGRSSLTGMAVLHSYFPPDVSDHASLRLMLVDPRAKGQEGAFTRLLAGCESWAFQHDRRRVFVRFPAESPVLYDAFLSSGYRLATANMRLARGPSFSERGKYHLAAWAG